MGPAEGGGEEVGLEPGTLIDGWAFTQHDGTVHWDRAGIETWTPQEGQIYDSLTAWIRARKADGGAGLPDRVKPILEVERSKRTEDRRRSYCATLSSRDIRDSAVFDPLHAELAKAEQEREPDRQPDPDNPRLPRAERRAQAGVLAQSRRVRSATRQGWPRRAGLPAATASGCAGQPAGPGAVAGRPEPSLDGPRGSQPVLAPGLRHRAGQDRRGLRLAGRAAQPPRAARLAGRPVPRGRLGREAVHEATGDVGDLPAELARQTRDLWPRTPPIGCSLAAQGFGSTPRWFATRPSSWAACSSRQVGGPSVKPPQPAGLWEAVGYTDSNTARFTADSGAEKVHRRSLYTFWKRTSPPPQMTTLDAPSREACQVRRERTNTPLQALLLLNEPQFVEASRGLAERTFREAGPTTDERLCYMFRLATSRRPRRMTWPSSTLAFQDFAAHYTKEPDAAKA